MTHISGLIQAIDINKCTINALQQYLKHHVDTCTTMGFFLNKNIRRGLK